MENNNMDKNIYVQEIRPARKRRSALPSILLGVVIVLLLVNFFVIGFTKTSGSSMEPTIPNGGWVIAQRVGYTLERGDIVLAKTSYNYIVKRIVAIPGDTVYIDRNGDLFVNDVYQGSGYLSDGDYVGVRLTMKYDEERPYNGEYFLVGDNKENSNDSRMIGPVHLGDIRSKVVLVLGGKNDNVKGK